MILKWLVKRIAREKIYLCDENKVVAGRKVIGIILHEIFCFGKAVLRAIEESNFFNTRHFVVPLSMISKIIKAIPM